MKMKLKNFRRFGPFLDQKSDTLKFQKTLKFETNCLFITLLLCYNQNEHSPLIDISESS